MKRKVYFYILAYTFLVCGFLTLFAFRDSIFVWTQLPFQEKNLSGQLIATGAKTLISPDFTQDEKKPPVGQVFLFVGGDVMLSRNVGYYNRLSGYARIFGSGSYNPLLQYPQCQTGNCIAFLNLESLFSLDDTDRPDAGKIFRAHPQNIRVLTDFVGKNQLVVGLTNNHVPDAKYTGMAQTLTLLDENTIAHVGGGLTPEESHAFVKISVPGITICFQSYGYDGGFNQVMGGKVSRNGLRRAQMQQDIKEMKTTGCDMKIIGLHWGAEYKVDPLPRQEELAHQIIDEFGGDMVVGSHSHIPGKIEKYKGKYIFYSLGNFVFDQAWGNQNRSYEAAKQGFDSFYDYGNGYTGVATYMGLYGLVRLTKEKNLTESKLMHLGVSRITQGVHSVIDWETYAGVLQRIYPEYPLVTGTVSF